MPRFLPDSSCLIPALSTWHVNHERAHREIERRLIEGQTLVLAAPVLVEVYSVLTRLPPPQRRSPRSVWSSLERTYLTAQADVVALDADAYLRLLQVASDRGIAGGSIYDAVIMACAQAAEVDTLLTFNERQFRLVADPNIDIVVPT
jgi:predicted nucleic acid-binding protein